eukprot:g18674.t1
MCWSYQDESFWRGKSISMAEVISYAKSMALTRFKEAKDAKVGMDDVAVLVWCDMNVPHARNREGCLALCKGIAALNESSPSKTACVLTLPDWARESNPRGLFDEEKQVFEELYSLNQKCEVRWIDLWTHETKKNNGRRFGSRGQPASDPVSAAARDLVPAAAGNHSTLRKGHVTVMVLIQMTLTFTRAYPFRAPEGPNSARRAAAGAELEPVVVVSSWLVVTLMGSHGLQAPALQQLTESVRTALAESLQVCQSSLRVTDMSVKSGPHQKGTTRERRMPLVPPRSHSSCARSEKGKEATLNFLHTG